MRDRLGPNGLRTLFGTLLFLVSLLCWAFATPPESSPDDDFHIANTYCLADSSSCRSQDAEWPEGQRVWPADPAQRTGEPWTSLQQVYPDLWPYEGPRRLPCFNVVEQGDRRVFAQRTAEPADCLSAEAPGSNTPATVDDLEYYPQLAYRFFSLFTQDTIRGSVAAWRVVSCVTVVALALLSLWLTRARWRQPILLGWLLCSVPYGMFLFSSHNPSGLALAAAFAVVGPALSAVEEHRVDRTLLGRVALVAVAAVVAIGSRREGVLWLLASAVVVVLLAVDLRMSRNRLLALLAGGAAVVLLAAATGALGTALGVLQDSFLYGTRRMSEWQALNEAWSFLFFFDEPLGWLDVPIPVSVYVLCGVALFGSLLLGLAQINARKAVAVTVAALTPYIAVAAILLLSAELVQARYYLPLVFLLVVAVLSPVAGRTMSPWTRAQWSTIAAALALANAIAISFVTLRYVTGINTAAPWQMDRPQWWWQVWPGPLPNVVVGSLAFAAALAVVLPMCSTWRREGRAETEVADSVEAGAAGTGARTQPVTT